LLLARLSSPAAKLAQPSKERVEFRLIKLREVFLATRRLVVTGGWVVDREEVVEHLPDVIVAVAWFAFADVQDHDTRTVSVRERRLCRERQAITTPKPHAADLRF
jgi:hypothetical protein